MPLYNEESITDTIDKTRYERSYQVFVDNFIGKPPKITFKTAWVERDNETGEEVQLEFIRSLEELYESNEPFDLISPVDGSIIGSSDYDTLFSNLYSLFFHVATKTDNA